MVACYLLYTGQARSIEDGLAQFAAKRMPGAAGGAGTPAFGEAAAAAAAASGLDAGGAGFGGTISAPGVATGGGGEGGGPPSSLWARMYPSWRFLGRHLETHLSGGPPAIPRVLRLSYLIVAGMPPGGLLAGHAGFPIVQIYQVRRRGWCTCCWGVGG